MRNVHKFLAGIPGRKRPLGRCSGWEGITKEREEVTSCGLIYGSEQRSVTCSCEHGNEPYHSIKGRKFH
jgi:hypothetical protein